MSLILESRVKMKVKEQIHSRCDTLSVSLSSVMSCVKITANTRTRSQTQSDWFDLICESGLLLFWSQLHSKQSDWFHTSSVVEHFQSWSVLFFLFFLIFSSEHPSRCETHVSQFQLELNRSHRLSGVEVRWWNVGDVVQTWHKWKEFSWEDLFGWLETRLLVKTDIISCCLHWFCLTFRPAVMPTKTR